jgi:integrase
MGVRIRQRPDKPGWWLFIDHQGKQKKKHFTDKETALRVARQVRERLALGDFSITGEHPEAKPFSAYFETWLNGYGPTRLKLSTQELYWSTFKCHLKPFFGETDLTKLTREQVKQFLYEKVASGLSRDHVRNLLSALHACLNHAVEDGHIPANPAARTSKLLYVRKEEKRSRIVFLTPEEEARLLETCREHFPGWYPFVLTLLRLGVRIGEACALQWGDFDLEARAVEVRRNYVDGKMTTPKNGSGRRIDVSLHLAETLRALQVERKRETLKKGWREMPPWVFVNAVGNPVDPDNFRKRLWAKILSKAELSYFPMHSLRHTFASRLIQNGATLLYVQHAMGHHSAAFTLQVYGHFQPTGNRSEVDKLDLLPTERTHNAKKTG